MTIFKSILLPCPIIGGAFLGMALASACFAQVKFTPDTDVVHIEIDGKPFADFHYGADVAKPYLAPLHAASGTLVTRQFPMLEGLGETTDHRHHRGLWVGYIDVNGYNFWENEFSYHNPKAGKIVATSVKEGKVGKTGDLRVASDWIDPSGKTLLVENRTMAFGGDGELRTIDIDFTFTAKDKCVFGDDKDGVFGIRLADPLTEKNSGTIVSSAGLKHMANVWGKPADWIDYSGEIKGERLGIAIFDHPSSFRHPARWHARDYGLFAVNPLGSQAFDKTATKSEVVLNPGEKLHFRYLVVIHPEMSLEKIGAMYQSWATKKLPGGYFPSPLAGLGVGLIFYPGFRLRLDPGLFSDAAWRLGYLPTPPGGGISSDAAWRLDVFNVVHDFDAGGVSQRGVYGAWVAGVARYAPTAICP